MDRRPFTLQGDERSQDVSGEIKLRFRLISDHYLDLVNYITGPVEDFEAALLMNASPWGFFSALETWDDSYYPAIESMSTWKDRDKFYNKNRAWGEEMWRLLHCGVTKYPARFWQLMAKGRYIPIQMAEEIHTLPDEVADAVLDQTKILWESIPRMIDAGQGREVLLKAVRTCSERDDTPTCPKEVLEHVEQKNQEVAEEIRKLCPSLTEV